MIGIGANGRDSLLPMYEQWIEESKLLLGGERQLSYFPNYQGEKVLIKGGLRGIVDRLQTESRETVILASGDPLFYGIGSYLSKKVENLEIYPYLSSVQLAFARMGERWQDAYVTSIHGRSIKGLAQQIDGKQKVAILTDEENSPSRLAEYLLEFGMTEYDAFVAEELEGKNERCGWYKLDEMADAEFSALNVVILKQKHKGPVWSFGIEDQEFLQRKPEKGLITKKEIRVLSLSGLELAETSVVWDIGTCTGSMAIEAAKIARFGEVFAIEKNQEDLENAIQNTRKFRTDITLVHGKAPEHLSGFPNPDGIFIGGTAGNMDEILRICCERLNDGGSIVLNAVTLENLHGAMQAFEKNGFDIDITHAQISRSKPILHLTRMDALNPVYIIKATRKMVD